MVEGARERRQCQEKGTSRPPSETRCKCTSHPGARVNATAEYTSNASAHHALESRGAGLAGGTQWQAATTRCLCQRAPPASLDAGKGQAAYLRDTRRVTYRPSHVPRGR